MADPEIFSRKAYTPDDIADHYLLNRALAIAIAFRNGFYLAIVLAIAGLIAAFLGYFNVTGAALTSATNIICFAAGGIIYYLAIRPYLLAYAYAKENMVSLPWGGDDGEEKGNI